MVRLSFGAFALVAALAVPFAASAQTAPAPAPAPAQGAPAAGHHHHHASRYMRAMRGLNLTADQRARIEGIIRSARTAQAANGAPVDPQTRRQNTLALRQQIESVLTDTQRAQLHINLKRERRARQAGAAAPQAAPDQPQ